MKNRFINTFPAALVIILVFTLPSCNQRVNNNKKNQKTIMVYAAASLTDVLHEIIESFEVEYPVKVLTNIASSGTLARQIEQGGTPDVFLSANKNWIDYVDSLDYIVPGFKHEIAQNNLVLIAPKASKITVNKIDSSLNFVALLGNGRLSMGDPSHVPAGIYAKQALNYYGWYQALTKKILPAKDVRSALIMVEMEEVPLGIVYRTDAEKSNKVKILAGFSENSHRPVVYVAAVCKDNDLAKEFFNFLNSDKVRQIWEKYGFKK